MEEPNIIHSPIENPEVKSDKPLIVPTPGKNGGARPGAGRPKGSTTKLKIREWFTNKEIKLLMETAKQLALVDKNPKAVQFLSEQLFGKAPQSLEVQGPDGLPFIITIMKDESKKDDGDTPK